MTAVLAGPPVTINWGTGANPAGQSISIPADATAVYVFGSFYLGGGGAVASITLAGASPDDFIELNDTALTRGGFIAAWYNTSTGSQTLDPAWDAGATTGPCCTVVYVKHGLTDAWRDADTDADSGANAVTVTLTTEADDLVIKFDTNDTGAAPSLSAGWSSLTTQVQNADGARCSYIVATGATQVCNSENESASILVALAIKPSPTIPLPTVAAKTSANIVSAVLALSKPSGVAVGDALVIFVGSDDDTDTANWDNVTNKPTGFTLIREAGSATVDAHIAAFWKIADGTESAIASIPKAGGSDDYWGAYLRITGAHETTPIHNVGSTTFAAATVSATFAPVTTSAASCLLIFGVSYDGGDATFSVNAVNGWTQLMNVVTSGASAGGGSGLIATREAAGASANAGPAASFGLSDGVVAYTIAIAPAAGAAAAFNPYPVIWQNYRNMGIM